MKKRKTSLRKLIDKLMVPTGAYINGKYVPLDKITYFHNGIVYSYDGKVLAHMTEQRWKN